MTEHPTRVDVLVVGAGPVGLALALDAVAHGASVRIVERRIERFRPSRAMIVHPRTLELLRPLGVCGALLRAGEVSPPIRLHLGRREVALQLGGFSIADTQFPYLLFVPQATVEAVLADALAARGVMVERGAEFVGIDPDQPLTAMIHGPSDELVPFRFLVGCDGGNSTVRRHVGAKWQGHPYRVEVVLADLELVGALAPGSAHAVAGRGGVLFVFASGELATWRLLATRASDRRRAAQAGEEVPVRELKELLSDAGLPARIVAVAWSARVPLEHRIASRYRNGPYFLAGDAAHLHSPAGGQGMNTGIQDALNLGWKLAFAASRPGGSADRLLDSYEAERQPVARRGLVFTRAIFWGEAGLDPVASFVRARLMPLGAPVIPIVLGQRRLLAQGIRILSQLTLRYPRSPLSVAGPPGMRHGAALGKRLPDATVRTEGGVRRLHELTAQPGVHLLYEREADCGTPPAGAPFVNAHRILDWHGRGVLGVRPDGYVGLRSANAASHEVADWLSLVHRPALPFRQ